MIFVLSLRGKQPNKQKDASLFSVGSLLPFEITPKAVEIICDALRDLVAFVQFKKREKHP